MDKLIKVLSKPGNAFTERKYGVYELLYLGKDGEYTAHVTPEEYKVRLLKQKFIFEKGYSEKDIKEFEQAVIDCVNKEQALSNCD